LAPPFSKVDKVEELKIYKLLYEIKKVLWVLGGWVFGYLVVGTWLWVLGCVVPLYSIDRYTFFLA